MWVYVWAPGLFHRLCPSLPVLRSLDYCVRILMVSLETGWTGPFLVSTFSRLF